MFFGLCLLFNLPNSLKRTRVDSDDEPLMVDVAVPEVGYVIIIFYCGNFLQQIFLVLEFMPVPKSPPEATHLLPPRKGKAYFIALVIYVFIPDMQ